MSILCSLGIHKYKVSKELVEWIMAQPSPPRALDHVLNHGPIKSICERCQKESITKP